MITGARVYVMQGDGGTLKVGVSNAPLRRLREVTSAVGLIYETEPLQDPFKVEELAHRILIKSGKHISGEWFAASPEDAIEAIKNALRGIQHVGLTTCPVNDRDTFRTALSALGMTACEFAHMTGHTKADGDAWWDWPPPIAMTLARFLLERPESKSVLATIAKEHKRPELLQLLPE